MAPTRRAAAIATRPQQPTDSPAASLPNETLSHIFDLSLERMKPWDKQLGRINFGKVCYTWYGVALPLRDCVVPDSKHAQDLATVLKAGRTGERAVRSLEVEVEPSGAGRGNKIAKLLRLCPNLQHLSIFLADGTQLCASGRAHMDGSLGKPVNGALKILTHLQEVKLEGVESCPWSLLDSFFESWTNLHSLALPDTCNFTPAKRSPFSHSPSLRHFAISTFGPLDFHEAIFKSSASTLTSLDLGPVEVSLMDEALLQLQPLLPQLISLKMHDGYGCKPNGHPTFVKPDTTQPIEAALKQLKAIRNLTLGMHAMNYEKLFKLLLDFKELRHFALDADIFSDHKDLRKVSSDTVANYIRLAPSVFRTITFPAELTKDKYWSGLDEDRVLWAARCADVKTVWITKVKHGEDLD